jgi:predicted nucleic acid-binding protein
MAEACFDTSALLKRFVEESGAASARQQMRRYRIVCSTLAPLEAFSALSRRRQQGDLADADFDAIVASIRREQSLWELIELREAVLRRAELVIAQSTLRTLDAVHVASALVCQDYSPERIPFITADMRQGQAAKTLGLDVIAL